MGADEPLTVALEPDTLSAFTTIVCEPAAKSILAPIDHGTIVEVDAVLLTADMRWYPPKPEPGIWLPST